MCDNDRKNPNDVGKKYNFLQKLRFRQLNGRISEHSHSPQLPLFHQLPSRLAFPLPLLAPHSALIAGHIFLGFTKCGQFLLSYTHSFDSDGAALPVFVTNRYRLHWWLMVPYAPLRKVAEVLLFGEQDIQGYHENLSITICQWPNDLTKILVYATSIMEDVEGSANSRRCYLTITAVPSLDGCKACLKVATSYEEEEVAERWNSCIRFSCLKHGYTVHTSYEMVPPYPPFLPTVQLKYRNWVVLNTGNFIHVINVSLENHENNTGMTETSGLAALYQNRMAMAANRESEPEEMEEDREIEVRLPRPAPSNDFNNGPVTRASLRNRNISDNLRAQTPSNSIDNDLPPDNGESSSSSDTEYERGNEVSETDRRRRLTVEDKDREWETFISSVPTSRTTVPNRNDVESLNSNMIDTDSEAEICANDSSGLSDSSAAFLSASVKFDILRQSGSSQSGSFETSRNMLSPKNRKIRRKYQLSPSQRAGPSGFQRSELGYQLNSSDELEQSTNVPSNRRVTRSTPIESLPAELRILYNRNHRPYNRPLPDILEDQHSPTNTSAESEYEFIDEISGSRHEKLSVYRKRRLADKKYEFSDENSENLPANYRSYRTQRCQSVLIVPSPAVSPRNYAPDPNSPHPASDGLRRSVYERLLSPGSSSAGDVLRPINQNISSPLLSPRDLNYDDRLNYDNYDRLNYDLDRYEKSGFYLLGSLDMLALPNTRTSADVAQNMACVVQINRHYIEVDDELVSIITDIEDDELSSSTGYHSALPLEVHGAGYTQMHMISSTKAEKLSMPGLRVRQLSLDVEQFCHSTAHSLCMEADLVYSCCCDYNVEIVDVCPDAGNIVAVASFMVQADINGQAGSSSVRTRTTRSTSHQTTSNAEDCSSMGRTRKLYKTTATFVFSIHTKEYYVIDRQPLKEEDPFLLTRHEVCSTDCEERNWWKTGTRLAQQLRTLVSRPSSYYGSVKVLTNDAICRGTSLRCIMEGHHLMAVVFGPLPEASSP